MAQSTEFGTGSFYSIVEAILYDYAPYLSKRGAHVWVEEVNQHRFVIGFTSWADRDVLRAWLDDRLRSSLHESVYRGVSVKDFSDARPRSKEHIALAMSA